MKFKVEYQFIGDFEIIKKEFDDFIEAMRFQGDIVKKYKKKLIYCKIK